MTGKRASHARVTVCVHERKSFECMECAAAELARAQGHLDALRMTALQRVEESPEMLFQPVMPIPAQEVVTITAGGMGAVRFMPQRRMVGPYLIAVTPFVCVSVLSVEIAWSHLFASPGEVPAVDLIARPWEQRPELRFFRLYGCPWQLGQHATITLKNTDVVTREFRATIYGRFAGESL